MTLASLSSRASALLERWAYAAEAYWYTPGDHPDLGCYGPGYIHWGVQSNWNYAAAMATLAAQPGIKDADHWRQRALAALRFALATHLSGDRKSNDGASWGHGWISMLGIERGMHGVIRLWDYLTEDDKAALRRVLVSESDWLAFEFHYKNQPGVPAGKWNASGKNAPESNLWSGALLWRTAQMYPDHPHAQAWEQRAHEFLLNGVSVEADAEDETIIAGRPLREWHRGANFFPNYALDHHGYLNVGYSVISMSNTALLYFDMKGAGLAQPESLGHHHADLWRNLRRMIFPDGRLARIGGDTRVRYAYCQEYLIPTLLYAVDCLQDPHALGLLDAQLTWIEREAEEGGEGLFYSARLPHIRAANPHYYSRLESDRACVLAMLLNFAPLVQAPALPEEDFETSVRGEWLETEHGAAMTRSERRLASFAWRASGLTQALCLPPNASDLAEWQLNLAPVVRFLCDEGKPGPAHRKLLRQTTSAFPGGLVTCGAVQEGVEIRVDEGAFCTDQAVTHIAFAALPDDRTCLGLQCVVAAPDRLGIVVELKGLHLNIPNDLFNNYRRVITTAAGKQTLTAPAAQDAVTPLNSRWANVDGILGVAALYGGESLLLDRAEKRRAGKYDSLYVEEINLTVKKGAFMPQPGSLLLDLGFAVLSGADAAETAAFEGGELKFAHPMVRGVWARGADGKTYWFAANFGEEPAEVSLGEVQVTLQPGEAVVR